MVLYRNIGGKLHNLCDVQLKLNSQLKPANTKTFNK